MPNLNSTTTREDRNCTPEGNQVHCRNIPFQSHVYRTYLMRHFGAHGRSASTILPSCTSNEMQGAWPWVPKLKVNPTLEHGAYQTNKNNGEGEDITGTQRSSALRLLSAARPASFFFLSLPPCPSTTSSGTFLLAPTLLDATALFTLINVDLPEIPPDVASFETWVFRNRPVDITFIDGIPIWRCASW